MGPEELLLKQIEYNLFEYQNNYNRLADLISECKGNIICTGVGKSSYIAMKFSATLASLGVKSFFLNPIEAMHGDLGRLDEKDLVIFYSNSGTTSELFGLMEYCLMNDISTGVITGNPEAKLAQLAAVVASYSITNEICPNDLAPTSSTTLSLIFSELIAVSVTKKLNISAETFWSYHPSGALGMLQKQAKSIMHSIKELPHVFLSDGTLKVRQKISESKYGCVLVYGDKDLCGIVTDGDLRRQLDEGPIQKCLNSTPISFSEKTNLIKIKQSMVKNNINLVFLENKTGIVGFIHYSDFM